MTVTFTTIIPWVCSRDKNHAFINVGTRFTPAACAEWRAWLERRHSTSSEIWWLLDDRLDIKAALEAQPMPGRTSGV